ncbi:MAG: hypothetical protein ABI763_07385 [Bacteroidota bacterium]
MKKILFAVLAISISTTLFAQKGPEPAATDKESAKIQKKFTCDSVVVDWEAGLLNGKVNPDSPVDSIKKYLPCVSAEFIIGSEERVCGGGAFLEKPGIFFNTEHHFIEFSSTTAAHFPAQVFGVDEEGLPAVTGDPAQITDMQPYADRPMQSVYLYAKKYGCLAVWVDQKDKKAFKVQMHNQPPDKAFLCVE